MCPEIGLNSTQAKIKQIISNLLNNAFEASNNNTTNIKVIVDLENQNIIIHIQDFGCGITEKDLNDLKNGKSTKVDGNGIGLSTADKFMVSINGSHNHHGVKCEICLINHQTILNRQYLGLFLRVWFAHFHKLHV